MKVVGSLVLMLIGFFASSWGSRTWDAKDGFLWGLLTSGVFDFGVSLISGSSKLVWDQVVKNNAAVGAVNKIACVVFAVVAGWIGYTLIMLGWHHWWTGFWASVLLGIPGLLIGGAVVVISFCQLVVSVVPSGMWMKFRRK